LHSNNYHPSSERKNDNLDYEELNQFDNDEDADADELEEEDNDADDTEDVDEDADDTDEENGEIDINYEDDEDIDINYDDDESEHNKSENDEPEEKVDIDENIKDYDKINVSDDEPEEDKNVKTVYIDNILIESEPIEKQVNDVTAKLKKMSLNKLNQLINEKNILLVEDINNLKKNELISLLVKYM
jgi:hypothetical protein